MISAAGVGPGSGRPLPVRRLIARTVMSWSQTIWQDSRTPVDALRGEHVAFGHGHLRGLALDELDAAGRAAGVAATRVQDVHLGVLLDREHQALALFDFNGSEPFNSQLRHIGI